MFRISCNPGYLLNTFINRETCSDKYDHFLLTRTLWNLRAHRWAHTIILPHSLYSINQVTIHLSYLPAHYALPHVRTRIHACVHETSCINKKHTGRHTADLSLMFLRLSVSFTLTCSDFTFCMQLLHSGFPVRWIVWDNQNNINFTTVLGL